MKTILCGSMILSNVATGIPGAIEECLTVYGCLVWSLARKMSPTFEDAEEAVQEIFLDVWRHAGTFDSRMSSEATFVAMIARRRLVDRHRRRESRIQPEPLPATLPVVPDSGPYRAEHCEDVELVGALLEKLRPTERRVLELAIGQGLTRAEISTLLGVPVGTVKSLARRGLIRLRTLAESRERLR